jgi:hypothetical protein
MTGQSWVVTQRPTSELYASSTFAEPSAKLMFTAAAWQEGQAKAGELGAVDATPVDALTKMFLSFANSDDPPSLTIRRATVELAHLQIASVAPNRASQVLLRNLGDVQSTHDFRAWCWQCVWALGNAAEAAR